MSSKDKQATIKTRFKELLAIKEQREDRRISRVDVMRETGLKRYTVDGWANNTLKQFNVDDIAILSRYFGVGPGELFIYSIEGVGDNDSPETEELPMATGI